MGRKAGQPKFVPTDDERKTVELMCAVGIAHEGIALCIRDGIDDKTLRKHFRKELDTAAIRANAKVGGSMFQQAINGNVNAGKWWTAARMGWKETTNVDLGGNVSIDVKLNGVRPTDN
jgi:hypothetical protein